jgi:hypothetical protein
LIKHTKANREENKLNKIYLNAKTQWERAAANLKASTDALEQSREHARSQTELLREKTAEVDRLRAQKATDDVSADCFPLPPDFLLTPNCSASDRPKSRL